MANAGSARISVLRPERGSYAGTADAVYQNLGYLNGETSDNGYWYSPETMFTGWTTARCLLSMIKLGRMSTVGVIRVPVEEAHRFGTVMINAEGRIQEFVEKSSRPLSTMASMGIYVFNKDILAKRLIEDASIKDSPHDFGFAVLPGMVKRDKVFAYEFNGYWQDIGTVEAYYQANMELLIARPRFSLDSNWPVLSDHNALPVPEGSQDSKVVNSLISPGCIIKGRVENSVLSPGVHVEEQAIIRNSIVMANTLVGYHSVVDSCIIDEGVQIGRFCYIGFGNSLLPGDGDITVLGKDVVVPPHTAIGRKCKMLPKVGPGDFRANLVPSGTFCPQSNTG